MYSYFVGGSSECSVESAHCADLHEFSLLAHVISSKLLRAGFIKNIITIVNVLLSNFVSSPHF